MMNKKLNLYNYHIRGNASFMRCPKNAVKFNTHNSKEHEMTKASICYDIQKAGGDFITEAVRNTDGVTVDVVDLREQYPRGETEVVLTHGLKQAVAAGRTVVMCPSAIKQK